MKLNLIFALWAVVNVLAQSSPLSACSTPVHRYAMYNWEPAKYLVSYFYDGSVDPKDAAANDVLRTKCDPEVSRINLTFLEVDLQDTEMIDQAPKSVARALREHSERAAPFHMVFSPLGVLLYVGRLDAGAVGKLLESPARKHFAELVASTQHGAMLFLPGSDSKANEKALAEVDKAIRLAEEKVLDDLPAPPAGSVTGDAVSPDASTSKSASEPAKPRIEVVKLARDDAEESWLVKQLDAVEDLTPEEKAKPRVFGLYGRARALEPYLGDGITAENLLDMISFMNGPCSCEVKDQNPGVDLLVTWDWTKAAADLAKRVGPEPGNQVLLEELGMALEVFEVEPAAATAAVSLDAVSPEAVSPEAASPEGASSSATSLIRAAESSEGSSTTGVEGGHAGEGVAPAESNQGAESSIGILVVLVPVLGLAGLGLAVATFLILRRALRSP